MDIPTRLRRPTPGQTVGPFFAYGIAYDRMHQVVSPYAPGAVRLSGTVSDGAGSPVPDAVIEIFGAGPDGRVPRARGAFRRDDHTFTGFGRAFTDDDGRFQFFTLNPAAQPGKAAFYAAIVYARGLTDKLHTRIYLPDDPVALARDPLLSSLEEHERSTLLAVRGEAGELRHDIRLQGDRETVFLAY